MRGWAVFLAAAGLCPAAVFRYHSLMPRPDQYVPFPFPLAGLDVSTGYDSPPPLTTQAGVNVRSFDPLTMRERGGSRPGIAKYGDQLPSGANLVQTLGLLVVGDTDALLDSVDIDGGTDDPSTGTRNPGRTVRTGGSGVQPSRHAGNNKIQFIMGSLTHTVVGGTGGPQTLPGTSTVMTFPGPVKAGDTIIVCTSGSGDNVTDALGNIYTQAGITFGPSFYYANSLSDGTCTVTVTPATATQAMVYRRVKEAGPVDDTSTHSGSSLTGTTGSVIVLATGEMLLAAFETVIDTTTTGFTVFPMAAGTGFTLRDVVGYFTDPTETSVMWLLVEDLIGVNQDQAATAAMTAFLLTDPLTPIALSYAATGASFKRK